MKKDFIDFINSIDKETFMTIINKSDYQKYSVNLSSNEQEFKNLLKINTLITLDIIELYHNWLHE
ncbi:hypothetical protein [Clostridium neonatale]|uniref:hypothetical protein n=1 Tax=Clostridium neonatale TaxID=137838 RepID=UPI00291B71CA|nr:hypothetical protein [Clostridium neonatale]CAI3224684.1 conserved hypothetical protein [Clostridium neonatale]